MARFASILVLSLVSFTIAHFINFKFAFAITLLSITIILVFLILKNFELRVDKSEFVFLSVFLFFIFLRFLDPSIFDAEKFMDMAFMNSILKSPSLPPNDPFFASARLDCYYYFGHVFGATIILLSFSPSEIGYNVAVSAIPAYTALLIFGIFREEKKIAFLAIFLTMFSGNAYSFLDFLLNPFSIGYLYYWNSTRVIDGTINEFPYFSFIHADLHAHVFAIPIKVFLITLLSEKRSLPMIPLTLFAIFIMNPWDFPLVFLFTLLFSFFQRNIWIFIYSLFSLPFVFLYFSTMNLPKTEIIFSNERTDALQFLGYSATLLLLISASLDKRKFIYSIGPSILFYFFSPLLPILIPFAISTLLSRGEDQSKSLILTGIISFVLPEFLVVDSRMNTVFKFYLVAWIFISIGAMMKFKTENMDKRRKFLIAILLVLTLVYPVVATPLRYHTKNFTLDGMDFTRNFGEYKALQWLKERKGVIIEEGCTRDPLCGYSYGGRVAVFTGNPTVIAWTNHEFQWRRNYEIIAERARDVRKFYSATNCEEMIELVEKYKINYIFLGYEERKIFSIREELFEKCFRKVFEDGNVKIFQKN
ncbi:MAG: DUF2298 domain-containing protein [Archaeoglobaceae archaeon]|nr:DUF2298 domain-containing protein [Archaeoglobaceae archaeon]